MADVGHTKLGREKVYICLAFNLRQKLIFTNVGHTNLRREEVYKHWRNQQFRCIPPYTMKKSATGWYFTLHNVEFDHCVTFHITHGICLQYLGIPPHTLKNSTISWHSTLPSEKVYNCNHSTWHNEGIYNCGTLILTEWNVQFCGILRYAINKATIA